MRYFIKIFINIFIICIIYKNFSLTSINGFNSSPYPESCF